MIKFTVTFDQAVTVVGTPEFEFCLGNSGGHGSPARSRHASRRLVRSAAAVERLGHDDALVFSYTVARRRRRRQRHLRRGTRTDTIKLDGGDTIQGTVGGLDCRGSPTRRWAAKTGHKVNGAADNTAAMGAPTITGTAQVGETLTAATTGITDADGLTSVTGYTYQWIRANGTEADIASANSSTYILIAAEPGQDHQGQGELHRRRQQCRDADQRGDGDGGRGPDGPDGEHDVVVTSIAGLGRHLRDQRDDPVHGDLRPVGDGHGHAGNSSSAWA